MQQRPPRIGWYLLGYVLSGWLMRFVWCLQASGRSCGVGKPIGGCQHGGEVLESQCNAAPLVERDESTAREIYAWSCFHTACRDYGDGFAQGTRRGATATGTHLLLFDRWFLVFAVWRAS